MRIGNIAVIVLTLVTAAGGAGDNKAPPTTEDDWKTLLASRWVNENPEAAWNKLSEDQKKNFGGKAWKQAEIEFINSNPVAAEAPKPYLTIRYFAAASDKPLSATGASFRLHEDKGARFLAIKNRAGMEHKIEYSLKEGKLSLKGTYYSLDPQKAKVQTPVVFGRNRRPATRLTGSCRLQPRPGTDTAS